MISASSPKVHIYLGKIIEIFLQPFSFWFRGRGNVSPVPRGYCTGMVLRIVEVEIIFKLIEIVQAERLSAGKTFKRILML